MDFFVIGTHFLVQRERTCFWPSGGCIPPLPCDNSHHQYVAIDIVFSPLFRGRLNRFQSRKQPTWFFNKWISFHTCKVCHNHQISAAKQISLQIKTCAGSVQLTLHREEKDLMTTLPRYPQLHIHLQKLPPSRRRSFLGLFSPDHRKHSTFSDIINPPRRWRQVLSRRRRRRRRRRPRRPGAGWGWRDWVPSPLPFPLARRSLLKKLVFGEPL